MALPETGNDWVEWKGGECPLPAGTRVDVKFRSGAVMENQVAWGAGGSDEDFLDDGKTPAGSHAGSAFWRHGRKGHYNDIIAYRIVKAESANDGWIKWEGGERPVVYGMLVDVKHRNGRIALAQPAGVGSGAAEDWSHTSHEGDIIAYRLAQPVDESTPASENQNILREAETIIYGDREETYGHPAKNLESIARFWTGYLKQKYGLEAPLNPEDVCWMMALLKMSRQMNSHKRDNLVDAAGYLALIERVQGASQ